PQEEEFADSPIGLELVDWWCFTYNVDAGLSIASVELLPATTSVIPKPPTTEPAQLPIMDIWAAAAQGNLEAVKRHLAAGAEIDATFIARGIPASGATPLHLAVLCDQGEIAQFLIRMEANLNAKAKDEHGGTPLHWAAALGRIEMARRLIEAGADVNAKDNNGFTPLDATHYDPESNKKAKLEIAELLREKGGRSLGEHQGEPSSQ
ncbi:MAG TPA: ankyrin repeat domain-containing protein, partial [Phycisphaerae bacterium]|nr:ankyrin repeat domain-containing protein [Phycisphaerae bacterium]